jgi:hypothetical protein
MNTALDLSRPRPWAAIASALPEFEVASGSAHGREHSFATPEGARVVHAACDEDWIEFTATPNWASALPGDADWLSVLAASAALPAGFKYALRADGQLRLCTECPAEDVVAAPEALRDRILGLTEAASATSGTIPLTDARPESPAQAAEPAWLELRQALAEAGWNCLTRPDGRLAVALEVRAGFYQAEILPASAGGWRLSATLLETDVFSDASRRAVSFVLLRAAEVVRLVRPSFVPRDEGGRLCFETHLPPSFRPSDVVDALSSLAAACGLCGEEVKWLCQEQIAKDCLALGLGNPARTQNEQPTERRTSP